MRLLLLSFLVSCGASGRATSPPASSCSVSNRGPLVGYSYEPSAPLSPTGGAIPDGTYDLVSIAKHTNVKGEWSSNNAPAVRWALSFKTTEHSPNHIEGSLGAAMEIPPAVSCGEGRFATVEGELRLTGGPKGISAVPYALTPDGGLVLLVKDGSGAESYVFRRR